jgi:hypothetical protein
MFSFFKTSLPGINYKQLIQRLERFDKTDISELLFDSEKINYLPATFTMLEKMARPFDSTQTLKVYAKYGRAKYEMAIFEVPWDDSDLKFLPLIIDKKVARIVGIMLLFDELLTVLTHLEQKQIRQLSSHWIAFVVQQRFGI